MLDPKRGLKRRRVDEVLDGDEMIGSDRIAQPKKNNIGVYPVPPGSSSNAPKYSQMKAPDLGKKMPPRKLGEPRHDIQKRLQWQYEIKKRKYQHIIEAGRVGFVPLIAASNGAIHKETKFILSLAARRIAESSGSHTSCVMGWLRARVTVAILRAASMQLRCERGANRRKGLGVYSSTSIARDVFRW